LGKGRERVSLKQHEKKKDKYGPTSLIKMTKLDVKVFILMREMLLRYLF